MAQTALSVRPAGIITNRSEPVREVLKIYDENEMAEFLIRKMKKPTDDIQCNTIYEDNITEILSPEMQKSRFVAFREKFSEDMFFKKVELGKIMPTNSKPDHITNENRTFGINTSPTDSVYDLVFPNKSPEEVNRDYIKWHDKYIVSHNHYFPSERKNRNYDKKYFNPNNSFGMSIGADTTGIGVKKCMNQPDNLILISKAQKFYFDRSLGNLGKQPPRYPLNLDPDHCFGHPVRYEKCGVKNLLENIDPCRENTELIEAISYVNQMRHSIFVKPDFHVHDLKTALEKNDVDSAGFLPLNRIIKVAAQLHVRLDEKKMRKALEHFKMIEDSGQKTERVNYGEFVKLLQIQIPLPKTGNLSVMPAVIYNKDTTYRDLCKDLEKKTASTENDVIVTHTKAYIRPKEEETTTKDVISPDIPMHYGLGPSDFEQPRSKEDLRRIFKRVITDNFDKVWEKALDQLKPSNDQISVDQFHGVFNEYRTKKLL